MTESRSSDWRDSIPGPEAFFPNFKYERNREIFLCYLRGDTQTDIADAYGVTQPTISHVIEAFRRRMTGAERELLRQDFLREYNENRIALARLRDNPAPPAFSQRGDALLDPRTGDVVEDHSGRIQAMHELASQQDRAAKLLGLNAPQEIRADSTVRYVVEGVDPDSFI